MSREIDKKAKYCDLSWREFSLIFAFLNSPGAPGSANDSETPSGHSLCKPFVEVLYNYFYINTHK